MSDEVAGADAPLDMFAGVEGYHEATKKRQGLFFQIFKYRLAKRSDDMPVDEEGNMAKGWTGPWETENPNTGAKKQSYAFFYDRLVARIINVERIKKEFAAEQGGGKVINWNIRLIANGKQSTLQFTQKDVTLKRFLKMARNINFDRPVCFSAWEGKENGKSKQAFAIFQASDALMAGATTPEGIAKLQNLDNWDTIHEYWQRPKGSDNRPLPDSESKGADGTVMPRGYKDEDLGEWDYKDQDKFLIQQFREHIAPKMEELAKQYGVDKEPADTDGTPLFSGGPAAADIPVVTEAPSNPMSQSMGDLITGAQTAKCKELAQTIGRDVNKITQKLVGANLDELSQTAASFVQYKMQQRVNKMVAEGGATEPEVVAAPAPAPPPPPAPAPAVADDDDDWGEAPAPSVVVPPKAAPAVEDDDDDWGEGSPNPPQPTSVSNADDSDIPF